VRLREEPPLAWNPSGGGGGWGRSSNHDEQKVRKVDQPGLAGSVLKMIQTDHEIRVGREDHAQLV
jgi:hypothetical protein